MRKIFFILSLFFIVQTSWALCQSTSNYTLNVWTSNQFYYGCRGPSCQEQGYSSCPTTDCTPSFTQSGWIYLLTSSYKDDPNFNCPTSGFSNGWCRYDVKCDNQCDIDSIQCVRDGNQWDILGTPTTCNGKGCKSCDTTMNCISYPYTSCFDVPSSPDITCINGNCYGVGGSKWVSFYDKNCTNECGASETSRISGDTVYVPGGDCTDSLQCSPQTKCVDFSNGTYILFQTCLVGRPVVGNVDTRQTLAQITTSGNGSCKDNGYNSTTFPNSGGGNTGNPNHSQPDSINTDCLIYGVGCEPYQDSTNYAYGNNATPTKCWCEPFDGLNSVSYIKCPDGSSRVVYMSCDQWHNMFSSSSTTPPPSSGSGGGGVSSGSTVPNSSDSNPFQGKYPEYPSDQPTHNKNVQGALSGISDVIISIRDHLAQLKNYIMGTETIVFDTVPTRPNGNYSNLDSVQTDLGFTFDSLFNRIDTSRKIIDTSRYVSTGTCPIIKGEFSLCKKIPFFKGNQNVDMKFDFSDFFGFNLCTIIKAIILGFTSIVVFLLSFRVISKSGM